MAAGGREAKDALFDGLASIARALSSGRRAEIVELLAQAERTVDQVAEAIDQSVANTSHHLRTLARAGLVSTRREGTHVHYRLASDDVAAVWSALRRVADRQVDGIDRLAQAYLGDRDAIPTIAHGELMQRMERGDLIVIDVRPALEFAAGHLPGAVSIPPDRLAAALDALPADREVVAYCRGPYCVYADEAVRHLLARGRRALRLDEGLPEWRLAGGEIATGGEDAGGASAP